MTLAEDIAALHVRMDRADDACHEGEAAWYRFEIHRLEDARDEEARRLHRRELSRRYAASCWSGDTDAAAIVLAEIERFERQ